MKIKSLVFFILLLGSTVVFSSPTFADEIHACPGPRDQSLRPKIVGGWQADLENWPGQTVLRIHNPERKESAYLCGGTLIAPNWVLSAGHCFQESKKDYYKKDLHGRYYTTMESFEFDLPPLEFHGKAYLEVVSGTNDLRKLTNAHIRQVKNIIVHPSYTEASRSGHDIALIELSQPYLGSLIRLSPEASYDLTNSMTMVAGFGTQQWKAPLKKFSTNTNEIFAAGSEGLREVDLPTVANPNCASRYSGRMIGDGQICAGHEQGRKDSCQGDSGGPLVTFDKNNCPYQIGIVSWGDECAKQKAYGVYTRVSAYIPWIKTYVPNFLSVDPGVIHDSTGNAIRLTTVDQALGEIRSLLSKAEGEVGLKIRRYEDGVEFSNRRARLGDRYVFESSSKIQGNLLLIDIDAAGKVTQIFPNKFVRNPDIVRVSPGQTIQIPASNYGFDWFRGIEPVGKGWLLALIVPDEFVIKYQTVVQSGLERGLVPEKAPSNYLANLIDQIYGLVDPRGFVPESKRKDWAFKIVEYEIIK